MADESRVTERLAGRLFGWFSVAAAALCLAGTWGLVAQAVARRAHELAVRTAIGASPGRVVRVVMRTGLVPVAVGCAAGLAIAAASSRLIASYLFGIDALDGTVYAAAAAGFVAVAAVASVLPARRVLGLNTMEILKGQ